MTKRDKYEGFTDSLMESLNAETTPPRRVSASAPQSILGFAAQREQYEERIAELEEQLSKGATSNRLPVSSITPNPFQPRRVFEEEPLQALADDITENGLMQPIGVRKVSRSGQDPAYQIIFGERRYRAHLLAGLEDIAVLIQEDVSDAQMAELALKENLGREDLLPYEVAKSVIALAAESKNKNSLAKRLGLQRSMLYRYLTFNQLPDFVLSTLDEEPHLLSASAAEELVSVLRTGGDEAKERLQEHWPRFVADKIDVVALLTLTKREPSQKLASTDARSIQKLFVKGRQAGSVTKDHKAFTLKVRADLLTSEHEKELMTVVERLFSPEF